MEQSNRPDEVTKALFKLSRKSALEIAEHIGMLRPNLFEAMAGKRGIPESKQDKLNEVLGLTWGMPIPNQIHYWTVVVDLEVLKIAVAAFFPRGATIAGLWREGGKIFDVTRAVERQQFAIYDERTLVILLRSNFGVHHLLAKPIGPETVEGLQWRGGKVGSDTMVSLPKSVLHALAEGAYTNVQALREYLDCTPSVTWEDFLSYTQQLWNTPQQALDAVMAINITQPTIKPKPKMRL
ncbi:MAG: hypothetical protein Q8M99_11365 [Methylotenera sp.]|nr:hypothetical protein [Methylotenera sp.]